MLIDAHCHLTDEKLAGDVKGVLERAKAERVGKVITIGTHLSDNKKAIETAEKYENVFASIGIYPQEERETKLEEFPKLVNELEKQILSSKKVVGIGECGIDITDWENQRPMEEQKLLFEEQIKLAIKHSLPLIIHNRNGDKEVLELLEKYKDSGLKGVMHCYVSTWEYAKRLLDLNFYISFTGIITYKSGTDIHETVRNVPLDRFMVETDAPYLTPEGFRKEVNEPKYVRITAQKVAELKDLPLQEIEKHAYQNTCNLFGLDS